MENTTKFSATTARDYKDRVFRMIFKEKENLLSLYNALNGTDYDNPDELTVVTLEKAIYMEMKNDVAFVFDKCLSMYEHQSTINPNMPLRFLLYVSAEYNNLIPKKMLYSTSLVRIPEPRFVVFYNGQTTQPEVVQMRLSDAFEHKTETPELELRVRMYNINYGKNKELLARCKVLNEYSQYVECVRKYVQQCLTPEEAMNKAVKECIENDILKEFLTKNQSEVVGMAIFEYNEAEVMAMWKEEEYAHGLEDGRAEGELQAYISLVADHLLDINEASKRLNMTVAEFEQAIQKNKSNI